MRERRFRGVLVTMYALAHADGLDLVVGCGRCWGWAGAGRDGGAYAADGVE